MVYKCADRLRELAEHLKTDPIDPLGYWNRYDIAEMLDAIADEIDSEHDRRMRQCQRETKRAFGRYIRAITEEYERSRKRRRGDW